MISDSTGETALRCAEEIMRQHVTGTCHPCVAFSLRPGPLELRVEVSAALRRLLQGQPLYALPLLHGRAGANAQGGATGSGGELVSL